MSVLDNTWRDNRLNMIHEGTHGIQAMDLLGRKVLMENGRGLQLLAQRMSATADKAQADWPDEAAALRQALQQVGQATQAAWTGAAPAQALANAVPYLQAFGHTVVAWIWLDVVSTLGADKTAAAQGRSKGGCRYGRGCAAP